MWSNWYLLDLVIPRRDLPMFAGLTSASTDDAVGELVTEGWWQVIDDRSYWVGCKFSEWQQDKVQVEHRRAQLALAQRRKRLHDVGDHKLCIPGRCRALSTVDSAVESRDDPVRLRNGPVTGKPKTKSRQEEKEDLLVSDGLGPSVSVGDLSCHGCGSSGPTQVEFGHRVCVGRCLVLDG
jgi:hypothetical protein